MKDTMPALKKVWATIVERALVHYSDDKDLIKKVISTRRPSERDEVKDYRTKAIRLTTRAPFLHALDRLKNIFISYGTNIRNDENIDINETYEISGETQTLPEFVFSNLINEIIIDPNAVIGWVPKQIELENSVLLPSELPDTEELDIELRLIPSEKIVFKGAKKIKWIVGYQETPNGNKPVYMVADEENYILLTPKSKGKETVWQEEVYYSHMLGEMPLKTLGGYQVKFGEKYYYESFFIGYFDWADLYISELSDALSVLALTAHPYIILQAQECPVCNGRGKRDGKECGTCNGRGNINLSPHTVLTENNKGANENNGDIVKFANADTSAVKVHWETAKDFFEESKKALHLLHIDTAQSGVAKEIDREGLYSFLTNFGTNLFNIYDFLLQILERLNPANEVLNPYVNRPKDYKLRTEQDILEELKQLRAGNAPIGHIVELTKELFKSKFGADDETNKIIDFLSIYDVFFSSTSDDFMKYVTMDLATQKQKLIHVYGYSLLQQIAEENDLLNMSFEQIKSELDLKIVETMPVQPTLDLAEMQQEEEEIEEEQIGEEELTNEEANEMM